MAPRAPQGPRPGGRGRHVIRLHCAPDGRNINAGVGSTHLGPLAAAVVARRRRHWASPSTVTRTVASRWITRARSSMATTSLACLATAMRDSGTLYRDTMVATVMSNLGSAPRHARRADRDRRDGRGGRYVLEAMREGGYTLGRRAVGSRHHVALRHHRRWRAHRALAGLAGGGHGHRSPNLRAASTPCRRCSSTCQGWIVRAFTRMRNWARSSTRCATELGDAGRVLLRASGTEPLVRVMVEASTPEDAQRHADRLAAVVAVRLSL